MPYATKILLLSCFLLLRMPGCSAQELKMYKTFGGVVFELDTVQLSMKQTMTVLQKNPEAYQEFKKAKTRLNISSMMGFTGGLLVGFPVGTAIAGGDPEWGLAAGGAALLLGSIPIYRSFRGRAMHALDLYNGTPTSRVKTEFYFFGNRASLIIKF